MGKSQKLEIEVRKLANIDTMDRFLSLRRDSYVQICFSWYW